LLCSRPSSSPHAVKSRSRRRPDIGWRIMAPVSPNNTRHRNSPSIRTALFNLQVRHPWRPQRLRLRQRPHHRRRSQRGIIRMGFPFLANHTLSRVLTHLANISMWKASLRERKLRIRTRIKSFWSRNEFARRMHAGVQAQLRLTLDSRHLMPS
jgi:hypothetical protein